MSLPSNVITLKPMKGSELMKQAPPPTDPTLSRYTPPSKRGDEVKVPKALTADQLSSETSFPSLPMASPMTKSVSWGQLRARLSSPPSTPKPGEDTSMKGIIEQSLKRNEAAEEEAQTREASTDPSLMSKEKLYREGWEVLKLKHEDRRAWFNRSSYNMQEEPTEKPYAWPTPILSFATDKVQKLLQPL
jgi:hypothetical protein